MDVENRSFAASVALQAKEARQHGGGRWGNGMNVGGADGALCESSFNFYFLTALSPPLGPVPLQRRPIERVQAGCPKARC